MLSLESKENTTPRRGWWLDEPASDRKAFGMVLHLVEGDWTVARTLIGSTAEKAGVTAGERLASVDGYAVGMDRGDMYELQLLMLLDASRSHLVTFRAKSGDVSRDMEKLPLRHLLEFDYDNGGANLANCGWMSNLPTYYDWRHRLFIRVPRELLHHWIRLLLPKGAQIRIAGTAECFECQPRPVCRALQCLVSKLEG
jgi:hypothetical protein